MRNWATDAQPMSRPASKGSGRYGPTPTRAEVTRQQRHKLKTVLCTQASILRHGICVCGLHGGRAGPLSKCRQRPGAAGSRGGNHVLGVVVEASIRRLTATRSSKQWWVRDWRQVGLGTGGRKLKRPWLGIFMHINHKLLLLSAAKMSRPLCCPRGRAGRPARLAALRSSATSRTTSDPEALPQTTSGISEAPEG
jgi:hypothetical protein